MDDRKKTIALGLAATSAGFLGAAQAALQPPAAPGIANAQGVEAASFSADEAVVEAKSEWDLPAVRNERVDFWIDFLSGKNYDHTRLWLERIGKYGPMIQQKLAERGMPQDLLYLATIESGLDPNIRSHAAAQGMWQFIAETGQRYGLEVSRYVDERNDPERATDAALDYLGDLHERFGSWFLAAASYNTGENRVERILNERAGGQKGDEDLFWEIAPHLPRETRDYVPLMLAMAHIAKDPETYGFFGVEPMQPWSYERVLVPGGTTLADVAAAAGVDVAEVEELNAHLVQGRTPSDRTTAVRIPTGSVERFAANFGPGGVALGD